MLARITALKRLALATALDLVNLSRIAQNNEARTVKMYERVTLDLLFSFGDRSLSATIVVNLSRSIRNNFFQLFIIQVHLFHLSIKKSIMNII
jgi:hypothetical protein